jgi:hypothetical protein
MHTTPLAPYVAAEIRAEMARQNMTSAALAVRVARPKQTVHRWTAGQTPIAVDDLVVVCQALNLEIVRLFAAAVGRRHREEVAAARRPRHSIAS